MVSRKETDELIVPITVMIPFLITALISWRCVFYGD
jgi:hypothetical protein